MKLKPLLIAMLVSMLAIGTATGAQQPKYIFYFIGDGMGMGPVTAAEMYNRLVRHNDTPLTMMQFPVSGIALTYSASSPVTDSAAAGTALATGSKTKNGMLGMNADTVAVTSMARILKDDGYGVGIVTSVAPDDATPGAFYAHVPTRKMLYEIGVQAAGCDYEFIAGGGLRGLYDKQGQPTDLLDVMAANNVNVVRGLDDMEENTSRRVVLIGENGTEPNNIGYTIDSLENAMTLPAMTRSCMAHLLKYSPDKFFMMVEGGNIDHALHANDGGAAIKEILNFNEAIDIAYRFYMAHPDETLIVVTADHDTGGMTIGNPTTGYNAFLQYIDYQKVSKEEFDKYCRGLLRSRMVYTWDDMRRYLTDNFGLWRYIKVTPDQEKALESKFNATFELRNSEDQKTLYSNFNAFAAEVFKVFNDNTGIGFVATSHTGNPVPVFAVGVDAQRFSHLNNNIDIAPTILQIAGQNK